MQGRFLFRWSRCASAVAVAGLLLGLAGCGGGGGGSLGGTTSMANVGSALPPVGTNQFTLLGSNAPTLA